VRALDISEVAKRSGVPASALRYYEERGLIASIGRRGLKRVFEENVLPRLALIGVGQAAGFSLDELAGMFTLGDGRSVDRDLLETKARELDRTIRKLTAMRDGLRHAAACPAPSHMECPKFRRLVRAATHGARSRRKASRRSPAAPGTNR
jgi:DNA-binding transcriptional MerR regulator